MEHHNYVKTFELFRRKYNKRKEDEIKRIEQPQRIPSPTSKQLPERMMNQFEKEKRSEDDDAFFNGDDDDIKHENVSLLLKYSFYKFDFLKGITHDDEASTASPSKMIIVAPMRKSGAEMNFPSLGKRKSNDDDGVASIFGGTSTTPSINKPGKITIKIGSNSIQNSTSTSPPKEDSPEPPAPIQTILSPRSRRVSFTLIFILNFM